MAALAQKEPAVKFAKEITAKDLKAKLSIIAGPEMEGRETATEGQRKAAAFIEATFKKIGLKPGTSDGYQVYYPVYQDSVESNSFSVNGISLSADKDFTVSSSSIATGSWTADEISFASFGQSDTAVNNYDGLFYRLQHIFFPGLDTNGSNIQYTDIGHLCNRGWGTVIININTIQHIGIGFSCTYFGQFYFQVTDPFFHTIFCVLGYQ